MSPESNKVAKSEESHYRVGEPAGVRGDWCLAQPFVYSRGKVAFEVEPHQMREQEIEVA